jgi:hypothetical protein
VRIAIALNVGWMICIGLLGPPNQSEAAIAHGIAVWTNRYSRQLVYNLNEARSIAVDAKGNVFVTGHSLVTQSPHNIDIGTIGYSPNGIALWTNVYDGAASLLDVAHAIATDAAGNVFITGGSYNGTRYDGMVLAYSGTGRPLWTNYWAGVSNDGALGTDVAVDTDGTVFVTGKEGVRAFSNVGTPLWTNLPRSWTTAIGLDGAGKVFVAGRVDSDAWQAMVAAYSRTGELLWTNLYGSATGETVAGALAVDRNGNVFVTGSLVGTVDPSDYLTIGYSSAGVPLWTNRYNGPQRNADRAMALAVDNGGRVYVTGSSFTFNTTFDFATIAYANDGIPLWTNRYNCFSNFTDEAMAVVVDRWGTVVVSGNSRDSNSFDLATIGYSAAGVALWTNRYDGHGQFESMFEGGLMAAGPDGVVIAGSSTGDPPEGYDYAVVKYFTGTLPNLAISRSGDQIGLTWPSDADGFRLQGGAGITPAWSDVVQIPSDNGTLKRVTVPAEGPARVFRLCRDCF